MMKENEDYRKKVIEVLYYINQALEEAKYEKNAETQMQ